MQKENIVNTFDLFYVYIKFISRDENLESSTFRAWVQPLTHLPFAITLISLCLNNILADQIMLHYMPFVLAYILTEQNSS